MFPVLELEKKVLPNPLVVLISTLIPLTLIFCITAIGMIFVYFKRNRDDLTTVKYWEKDCKYLKWTAFLLCLIGTILAIYQSSIGGWLVAIGMVLGAISEVVKKKLQKRIRILRANSSLLNINTDETNHSEDIELSEEINI